MTGTTPTVTVVIATRDRPELLREAVQGVRRQTAAGGIEVIVVYDQSPPDPALAEQSDDFTVRVISNTRRPGLAGARNSGILAAVGEFVAFCDDDDLWLPGKLSAQLDALRADPSRHLVTCGIVVDYDGTLHTRSLRTSDVTFQDLLRDRLTELHPSTFLFRRASLLGPVGLVSEDVPGGFGEDYDLLLRTARQAPISNVVEPHVVIRWHQSSFFFRRWEIMAKGLSHIVEHHPEIRGDRRGNARIEGQIAFAEAARGRRRAAALHAGRAVTSYPLEPRAVLTALVLLRVLTPARVMSTLHTFGRGL